MDIQKSRGVLGLSLLLVDVIPHLLVDARGVEPLTFTMSM